MRGGYVELVLVGTPDLDHHRQALLAKSLAPIDNIVHGASSLLQEAEASGDLRRDRIGCVPCRLESALESHEGRTRGYGDGKTPLSVVGMCCDCDLDT